ncbi:MAG: DUF1330 domain-containing protein [Gammaproteobacteria bacterium]
MAAYTIGTLTVHDTGWQKEYADKMPALLQKHGGKVLARGPAHTLEGQGRLPGAVVMLEFPSAEHARAWYDDPAHDELKQLRRDGADVDLMLVPGV